MSEGDIMPHAGMTFYDRLRGKRVIVETLGMQVSGQGIVQPERFAGVLEDINTDGLLLRPDNGRLTLIFKHAILCVSEAVPPGVTP
ncbi:MAG TPA: hypothetical protein VFU63_11385 [Ktedonobacterales bacterium]|nr:hypothetical protein [Ktedonobacterales bacterium]